MQKDQREREVFKAFVELGRLPVDLASIESRPVPEPDIFCVFNGGPLAFELVDLVDQGLAQAIGSAAKKGDAAKGLWIGDPTLDRIQWTPTRTQRNRDGDAEETEPGPRCARARRAHT